MVWVSVELGGVAAGQPTIVARSAAQGHNEGVRLSGAAVRHWVGRT